MRKLLLGSIVLLGFNVAIVLTQMSCKKEASAQVDNSGVKPANLILFYKASAKELWIANIDGSNQKKLPITMPSNMTPGEGRLSPDGKTVIFEGFLSTTGVNSGLFSCSLDGSNFKTLVNPNKDELLLQDVK